MELRNYISKYCEKNSAPKKISYTMHDFPVCKPISYIKNYFSFSEKE